VAADEHLGDVAVGCGGREDQVVAVCLLPDHRGTHVAISEASEHQIQYAIDASFVVTAALNESQIAKKLKHLRFPLVQEPNDLTVHRGTPRSHHSMVS